VGIDREDEEEETKEGYRHAVERTNMRRVDDN
jgi:hypothetical protein